MLILGKNKVSDVCFLYKEYIPDEKEIKKFKAFLRQPIGIQVGIQDIELLLKRLIPE